MNPQATLPMGDRATITVRYSTRYGHYHDVVIAREPPTGLSALRMATFVDDYCAALTQRQQYNGGQFYRSVDERVTHAKWLTALADAMEREARMNRTLALRLNGHPTVLQSV